MSRDKYYIFDMFVPLVDILKQVSGNVFIQERPSGIPYQMDDFVVVSLPKSIENRGPYQKSYMDIELFRRNRHNGTHDSEKLQSMLDALTGLFPICFDRFSITTPTLKIEGDDGTGFGVWLVQAEVLVNTTDKYKN